MYIENITKSGVMSDKIFWHSVRPFLTNKGILIDDKISLIHNGKTIDNENQVGETLNHAYINIVEHISGNKPTSVPHDTNIELSSATDLIINRYEAHPSIIKIKMGRASGEDKVPPGLVIMASNFLSEPITNIISTAVNTNIFADRARHASVARIDKDGSNRYIYTNYKPFTVLNSF